MPFLSIDSTLLGVNDRLERQRYEVVANPVGSAPVTFVVSTSEVLMPYTLRRSGDSLRSRTRKDNSSRWSSQDDYSLWQAARAGSAAAGAELYDRYGDRAYRLAFGICSHRERAEHAVLTVFTTLEIGEGGSDEVRGSVAVALLASVWKLAGRAAPDESGGLASLSEPQRGAIALALYGRMSATEIAVVLDMPASAVKQNMRDGLAKVRGLTSQPDSSGLPSAADGIAKFEKP